MSTNDRLPFKALRPLGISGRVEKGEIVYLTAQEAKGYSKEDLAPFTPEATAGVGEDTRALSELSLAELKERAAAKGLKTSGSKADLIERLELADEKGDADTDEDDSDDESGDDSEDDADEGNGN